MKHLLIRNIARIVGTHDASIVQLRGSEMKHLPGIDHSWLLTEDDQERLKQSMPRGAGCSRRSATATHIWCIRAVARASSSTRYAG